MKKIILSFPTEVPFLSILVNAYDSYKLSKENETRIALQSKPTATANRDSKIGLEITGSALIIVEVNRNETLRAKLTNTW